MGGINILIDSAKSGFEDLQKNPVVQIVKKIAGSYLCGAIVGLITGTSMHQVGVIFVINQLAESAMKFLIQALAGPYKWTPQTVNVLNALTYAATGVALILTLKSAGIIATLGIAIFSANLAWNVILKLSTKTIAHGLLNPPNLPHTKN